VAHTLSFSPFILLFFLLLASRSDGSELPPSPPPPPPPLPSLTFCFTTLTSDPSLYRGDLLEALGDSGLRRISPLLAARFCFSSGCRDLPQLRMFGEQRFWRSLLVRVPFDHPIFGVDYSKLFFMKSPCHIRIVWQTRFDLTVACLAGIKAPNSLLVRTSLVGVALELFWDVVKICVAWCIYCCCCFLLLLWFLLLYSLATLYVGFCFPLCRDCITLYIGFCYSLCRVVMLLNNHLDLLLSRMSRSSSL
jgi:hypothetical protein